MEWIGQNFMRHSLLTAVLEATKKLLVRNIAVRWFNAASVEKKCINEGLQNRFTALLLKESCLLLLLVKGHVEAHVVVTYKWDRDFFFALTISTIFENFYWFREL